MGKHILDRASHFPEIIVLEQEVFDYPKTYNLSYFFFITITILNVQPTQSVV